MVRSPGGTVSTEEFIPELREYARDFEAAPGEMEQIFTGLSDEEFNWRPAENAWSVAETFDHLVVLGHAMLPQFDDGMARAEEKGWKSTGPFKYGAMGNWFVAAVGPSEKARKRKFKAPAIYTPSSQHTISRVSSAFTELQYLYLQKLERANGLDLKKIKVPSPALSILKLSLGQWFALLINHQKRHYVQAREVVERMRATSQK